MRSKIQGFQFFFFACVWGSLLLCSCSQRTLSAGKRPVTWAQPVEMEGVPNLHRVSEVLYRSAQPTATGMANLEKAGVKTVINLRAFDDDEDELSATNLKGEQLPILTWSPSEEVDEDFLSLLQKSPKPVLVHCKHGADRTGALCAIYRVREQGWSLEEALAEMTEGGFGFHSFWINLPVWVRSQVEVSP